MTSQLIDNRKITDGVISTPGMNTNTWYCRERNGSFTINGAFNGFENVFDWVATKTTNSRDIKSGVVKLTANKRTLPIKFETAFPSTDYFVFFDSSSNVSLKWCEKKLNSFTIAGSWNLGEEVTWLAIHKNFAKKTGVSNPGSIFAGSRTLFGPTPVALSDIGDPPEKLSTSDPSCPVPTGDPVETLNIENGWHANLSNWYNNEYIIRPTQLKDGIDARPNLEEYSVILSSNVNINTFWCEKATDRFKIGASFSQDCIIDYLMIKRGIDWWDEF